MLYSVGPSLFPIYLNVLRIRKEGASIFFTIRGLLLCEVFLAEYSVDQALTTQILGNDVVELLVLVVFVAAVAKGKRAGIRDGTKKKKC